MLLTILDDDSEVFVLSLICCSIAITSLGEEVLLFFMHILLTYQFVLSSLCLEKLLSCGMFFISIYVMLFDLQIPSET